MRPLLFWLFSFSVLCAAQDVLTTPPPADPPASPRAIPSPPDAPTPDLNSIPKPAPTHESALKRHLKAAAPRCLDAGLHVCWSQPEQAAAPNQFRRDVEVADFYFRRKNYIAAESRYREALDLQPGNPGVTFRLAECLDHLHRTDEARTLYQSYLAADPNGQFAALAKQALSSAAP
jgi:tetratricopeptide (TPR) repeat protein